MASFRVWFGPGKGFSDMAGEQYTLEFVTERYPDAVLIEENLPKEW